MKVRSPISIATLLVVLVGGAAFDLAYAAEERREATTCPAPGARIVEPYRWYRELDLARVPFHSADGPWGPRAPIAAPAPPKTSRTVYVRSASQLAVEAKTPGTRIIVQAAYIGPAVLSGDVTDVDIVVTPGTTISRLSIGRYKPTSTTRRVRIRGITPGTHSGGLVGRIVFYSSPAEDLIVDGLDLNGDDGEGGNLLLQFAGAAERVAVVNVRGHAVGPASLGHGANIVFAGNNIVSGARPGELNGYPEGWGIRGGDRIVVFGNRIEGGRYHRVRVHPRPGLHQYAWVAENIFVDPYEGRILTAVDWSGSKDTTYFAAVWAVCNTVYAHSSCISASFEAPHAVFAQLTQNAFFGSITAASQSRLQTSHGPGRDYLSGNKYLAWRYPPPWVAPGDPAVVPLPSVKPGRYRAKAAGLKCSPP